MSRFTIASFVVALACTAAAWGGITIPGADGSDGALTFVPDTSGGQTMTIDLSKAVTAAFDPASPTPSPQPGKGIYDPARWAVIFRYSSVNLNNGGNWGNVYFLNHPSGAPVVWLVAGDVTLVNNARIFVSGNDSMGASGFAEPGPGGFRGGRGPGGVLGSGGFGPGGGDMLNWSGTQASFAGGSFGTLGSMVRKSSSTPGVTAGPIYGNRLILPLIGGSGGSASTPFADWGLSGGGGAGGGAMLVACAGTFTLTTTNNCIFADGGDGDVNGGGGSGGAVRIIADQVQGNGAFYARAGSGWYAAGGVGRIGIQTNRFQLTGNGSPGYETFVPIAGDLNIWPGPAAPAVKPVSITVNGTDIPFPADPRASLNIPSSDLQFDTGNPVTLHIEATNVPLDWSVVVRITPKSGDTMKITAAPLQGTEAASTTTVTFAMPRGIAAIQVRANKP